VVGDADCGRAVSVDEQPFVIGRVLDGHDGSPEKMNLKMLIWNAERA